MKYLLPLLLVCGQVLACDCIEKIELYLHEKEKIYYQFVYFITETTVIKEDFSKLDKMINEINQIRELIVFLIESNSNLSYKNH